MEHGFARTRLDPDAGERFISLRRALGVSCFGINLMILQPGERGRIHRHRRQEEVYLVWEGTLTVAIEGDEQDLEAGEVLRVGPDLRRQLLNRGPERCAVVALGSANEHAGRDGIAFASWEDTTEHEVADVPLPDDLPATELRGSS
jgi:uncharacterized cupin superfamily protein